MNDQHPPHKPGDHVTLTDPRCRPHPIALVISALWWDKYDGEWYANLTWPNGTGSITRRVGWLQKGWPA